LVGGGIKGRAFITEPRNAGREGEKMSRAPGPNNASAMSTSERPRGKGSGVLLER